MGQGMKPCQPQAGTLDFPIEQSQRSRGLTRLTLLETMRLGWTWLGLCCLKHMVGMSHYRRGKLKWHVCCSCRSCKLVLKMMCQPESGQLHLKLRSSTPGCIYCIQYTYHIANTSLVKGCGVGTSNLVHTPLMERCACCCTIVNIGYSSATQHLWKGSHSVLAPGHFCAALCLLLLGHCKKHGV